MNPIEVDEAEKISGETSEEELLVSDSSDPGGVFGSPLMGPRVGDEYQAKIPPMLTQSDLELSTYPNVSESNSDVALCSFLIGQPVPVTWICKEANALYEGSSNEKERLSKVDWASYFLVPGFTPETWTDFEIETFTLGLYIFGKNLYQVQRFMESKSMGEIQSFYYGRFYKSPSYCKWASCRKTRNKKCVLGIKIFTGCRRQELMSRLLLCLSEESKNLLQEATNALVEERTSLEKYVSGLKSMVGIRALVDAIGIGRGKEDLTTLLKDNSSSGPRQRVRAPELPSGNACASLASEDIIKLLTSDFRLSKARSNNLFWGAVWPRLLAKGWHSKQAKGIYTAPRNGLIFLKPGIKKLSKSKSLNGIHYFDSISDILSKVASEPQLLEADEEAGPENAKEESNGFAMNLQKDAESPRYLKPQDVEKLMEFTVIDTSSPSKVRELRNLPAEKCRSSVVVNRHRKKRKHPLGDSNANTMETSLEAVRRAGASRKSALKQENQLDDSIPADQHVRTIKHKFSRREKADRSTRVGPVTKRQRPIACESGLGDQDVRTNTPVSPCDRKSEPVAQPQTLIDLNLPHVPVDSITSEQPTGQCNAAAKTEAIESSTSGEEISEEPRNASTRRHSTRVRPLTAKALEALEIGLLRVRQRKKRPPARSLDREVGSPRQVRSDESGYGETGSNGVSGPKMGVISCPLAQNNEIGLCGL